MKVLTKIAAILLAIGLIGAPVAAQDAARLSVVGLGQVAAVPDMATISLGVNTQARSAVQALDNNSASIANVLEIVASAGIKPRDVQTSGLSLSPLWNNRSSSNNAPPAIVGFSVQNQVTIRVRDLTVLGGLLDQVTGSGANQFNGLQFGLQDAGPATDNARALAVVDARRKAELYAHAAGVELGPIIELSEHTNGGTLPVMAREMAMSADVPIAKGEVTQSASVTMVFAIQQ